MKLSDLIQMCVRNLIRRKFRTFLTIMGVVIGTTSIIMMISLGIGISVQQEEQIKMWGDLTIIQVYWQGDKEALLDEAAVEAMQQIPGVEAASPVQGVNINSAEIAITAGKTGKYKNQWPSVMSVYPEALEKLGFTIDKGVGLPTTKTKKVRVVFGAEAAYEFQDMRKSVNNMRNSYPDENGEIEEPFFDPLETDMTMVITYNGGETSKKYEVPIEVCGTLVGERNKWESMYGVFFSIKDMDAIIADFEKQNNIKKQRGELKNFDGVQVKVQDIDSVADIEQQIKDMGYGTWSTEARRQEMQKSTQQIQVILGSLGAISLLVSAISITNTMIMSVYERTREIGVMKVLGCLVGNIRTIFLMEAGLIGFFGGVAGILLGYLLSFILNYFGGAIAQGGGRFGMFGGMMRYGGMSEGAVQISVIPLWLVLLGMLFATSIGLVSGFYPANRAVKISALEAIKQE